MPLACLVARQWFFVDKPTNGAKSMVQTGKLGAIRIIALLIIVG
jgi:hypothetical protein